MAPLSKKLVGVVLSHEKLGSHLDAKKKTINAQLERDNFAAAGDILANIWSEEEMDKNIVSAKYIHPITKSEKIELFEHKYDEKWADKHIVHGMYHLSIMKCDDIDCCGELRSNIRDILPNGEVPSPIFYLQNKGIITVGKKFSDPPHNHHYAGFETICTLSKTSPHG
eukprot:347467_1